MLGNLINRQLGGGARDLLKGGRSFPRTFPRKRGIHRESEDKRISQIYNREMGLRSLRGNLVKEREPKALVAGRSLSPKRWSLLEQGAEHLMRGHWAREPIWGGGASHPPSQTKRGRNPENLRKSCPHRKKKKRGWSFVGKGAGPAQRTALRGGGASLSLSLPYLRANC